MSDSQSFRRFARLTYHWSPSASCLQENISRIQASTWEQINRLLVGWAARQGLERGRKIRADATAVESHIPYPTDSQLLSDAIRVLTRTLRRLSRFHTIVFRDHRLRAKRRCMNIRNHRGKRRQQAYRDLLKVARKTAHYTRMALQQAHRWTYPRSQVRAGKLRYYLDLMTRIIDQTERRVLNGESVPAQEKVLSVFEEHTDIIKKKRRETVFGHKLYLTGGVSGLILDFEVVRGNPNDAAQFQPWIQRQYDLYGRWPRQASFDGCFASKANLQWAKDRASEMSPSPRNAGWRLARWCAPVGSTGNCDAFGLGSKVASRCSSASSVSGAAPGRAGPTFSSMWASRSPASTCWSWPACCCSRELEIHCQTAASRDPCVQNPVSTLKGVENPSVGPADAALLQLLIPCPTRSNP